MPKNKRKQPQQSTAEDPRKNRDTVDMYICSLILHNHLKIPYDTNELVDTIYNYVMQELGHNEQIDDIFNDLFVNTDGYKKILVTFSVTSALILYIKKALAIQKKVSARKQRKEPLMEVIHNNIPCQQKLCPPKNINLEKLNQELDKLPDSLFAKSLLSFLRNL